jgi:hypothetical protein
MLNSLLLRKALVICSLIGVSLLQSGMVFAAHGPDETNEGVEILMRGPIHEAFADVSVNETAPGEVIPRQVPEPVNEIPPDFRPEGEQIEWIPGYWSWDDDQNNFIWVSGVWRDVPPGRRWIPGYWLAVEGGNQYISGFWTNIDQSATVYLPPPPQPLEAGPSSPALTPNHLWIDGHWVWQQNRYAWQAGYWLEQGPEMVWIPAHYVWTPRGYVFVRGYWDYQFARRGVMFAPLHYAQPIYRTPRYYYSPTIVLDIDAVFLSLFIRRDSRHYYFGDYHDVRYEKRGFHPWYSKRATRYGYDPYYRSYRLHRLRDDRHWENNYHRQFQYRRDHQEARPPHIYRPQQKQGFDRSRGPADHMIGRRLADVVENRQQAVRFTRLQPDQQREFQGRNRRVTDFQEQRRKLEMKPMNERESWKTPDSQKPVKIPRSASPVKDNRGEKTPVFAEPRKKYQESRTVQPQNRTIEQPRIQQQERQLPRQGKTNGQPWTKQPKNQGLKPEDQTNGNLQGQRQKQPYRQPSHQPENRFQENGQGKQNFEKSRSHGDGRKEL